MRVPLRTTAQSSIGEVGCYEPSIQPLPMARQRLLDELPAYLIACQGISIDHSDVPTFTKE
eukprot:scaffold327508_cov89-Tisochrysis_lutea.AAC.1